MVNYKNIVVIGDIHGLDVWKKIVDKHSNDLIIFVGDYFDSFDIPTLQQIENFNKILEFKLENSDRVKLLIGNHDYHYFSKTGNIYSGYNHSIGYNMSNQLYNLVKNGVLITCYKHNDLLFTHAGVSNTWCASNSIDITNIDNQINDYMLYKPYVFDFISYDSDKYGFSLYGDTINQGPLWIRPNSLISDRIIGYTHIVGHTSSDDIVIDIENNIIIVDALHNNKYLHIKNGEFIVKEI